MRFKLVQGVIVVIFVIVSMIGCEKNDQNQFLNFENKTTHKIVVNTFTNKKLIHTIDLTNGLLYRYSNPNWSSGALFQGDSLIVIYDDSISITHNSVRYQVDKNILKLSSYQEMKDTVNLEIYYQYEFLEEDYLEAKNLFTTN